MALVKGTNSYATVDEASAYFADRLDVAAWDAAGAEERAKALVTATSVLDDQTWVGSAVSATQPLAFPRTESYFDPRLGSYVDLTTVTPDRLLKAVYEQAYHLLNNDGLLDDTGSVTTLSVSAINLSEMKAPNLIPGVVKRMIKPMLVNGGAAGWWRAN